MTKRIAMWLCVLLGASGCLTDSHEDPNDVASDDLGLQNGEAAAKPDVGPSTAGAAAPKVPNGSETAPPNCSSEGKTSVRKPEAQSEIDACYIKAKSCYADADDPAVCDELMNKCATLSPPGPKPAPDACALKVEKCQESGASPDDCVTVKLDCVKGGEPPKPADPEASEIESCWRKYKECYASDNDPASCESLGDWCKKLQTADLE
jgi:hypothetical protein